MRIKNFSTEKKIITASINHILKIIKSTLLQKSSVNIALSGGSTPLPIYKALGKKLTAKKLPPAGRRISQKINFYQVDERYVPATHKDSNQKMINENLIKKSGCTFHFFDTSLPIQKSLKEYSKILPKNFDLTILGIGHDGHVASLFPYSKALISKSATAHTTTKEFAIKDRLTLTFPTILKSKNILVLLKNKPEIIAEIKSPAKSPKNFPAHKLKLHKKLSIYFQS